MKKKIKNIILIIENFLLGIGKLFVIESFLTPDLSNRFQIIVKVILGLFIALILDFIINIIVFKIFNKENCKLSLSNMLTLSITITVIEAFYIIIEILFLQ